jgi:hypothetical protein
LNAIKERIMKNLNIPQPLSGEPLLLVSQPFINIHDAHGNEMICRIGGVDCVPLDDWTSKLT